MTEMMVMRDEIRNSLNDAQFHVFEEANPKEDMSFDMIARHNDNLAHFPFLLIKILQNIDNIKPYYINEIKLISHLINGLPIFIAKENRHSALQSDSIYIRQDIFAVNLPTFKKIISNPQMALALSFAKRGGFFHEINGTKLNELRRKKGRSRQDLAEKMKLSPKAISHYEKKGMRASIENTDLLQQILGESIIHPVSVFKLLQKSSQNFILNKKLQLRIATARKDFMETINEIVDETGYQCFWGSEMSISPKWSRLAKNVLGNEMGRHCHWCKFMESDGDTVHCSNKDSPFCNGDRIRTR